MTLNIYEQTLIGLLLFLVMLSIGSSLKISSFLEILKKPKTLGCALLCQYVLLPLSAVAISLALSLPKDMTLIFLLLSCCPGGIFSNALSHLAKANTSLSVSLTLIINALSFIATPTLFYLYTQQFYNYSKLLIPFANIALTLLATLIPLALGILLNTYKPKFTQNLSNMSRIFSTLLILTLCLIWLPRFIDDINISNYRVYLSAFLICLSTIFASFVMSHIFRESPEDKVTIAFEAGIQNSVLAFAIIQINFSHLETLYNNSWGVVVYGFLSLCAGVGALFIFRHYLKHRIHKHTAH